jgi:hypothetical protein
VSSDFWGSGWFSHYCLTSHTHNDAAYAKYAFNLCVGRTFDTEVPSPPELRETRSGQKRKAGEVLPEWPAGGGGSFVDTSLKVVVRGAPGTMMCFLPENTHGTTRLCGVHQRRITVAFSSRIADAYKKAQEGNSVVAGKGAGQGDPDAF